MDKSWKTIKDFSDKTKSSENITLVESDIFTKDAKNAENLKIPFS